MLRLTEYCCFHSTSRRVTILSTSQTTPWYRQFWPWFLLSLPATAVIACIITIVIAVQNKPSMVNKNYYLEGLSINERIKQDQHATELSMQANLLFSEETGKVNVYLIGNGQPSDTLILAISAPGDEQQDRIYTLKAINSNLFITALPELPEGRFYISLEPEHREWRLLGETVLPRQDTLVLSNKGDNLPARQ